MRRLYLFLTMAAFSLFPGAGGQCGEKLDLKGIEVNIDESAADDALKMQEDETEKGDNKSFTVVTDEDIVTLKVGEKYKSSQSFFTVKEIYSQGKDGGSFRVERIRGKLDPDLVWTRVQGEGPVTIRGRETAWMWFKAGGTLMWPLAACLLTLLIVTFRNVFYYRISLHYPEKFIKACTAAIKEGDLNRFEELALKQKGLLAQVCRAITIRFYESSMDEIKDRVQQVAAHEVSAARLPLRILNFVTATAPLLGLFGTVTGMIACFGSLAGETASQSKAVQMAAGIKEALYTTAFGLSIAVPALAFYFIWNQRLNTIIYLCERQVTEFLQSIGNLRAQKEEGKQDGSAVKSSKEKAVGVAV